MTIAYVFERDAADPDVQSSRPASILREFQEAGLEVHRCFPLTVDRGGFRERLARRIARRLGQRYLEGRSRRQLRRMAREIETKLAGVNHDVVFCPGTIPLGFLRSRKPVALSSDTTFRGMVGYYPEFSRLSGLQVHSIERVERAVLQRSRLLAYASEWAAQSAVSDYGVAGDRVAVIPSGANVGGHNDAAMARRFIAARPLDRIDLLFVGKAWARKGGDLCLETLRLLLRSGARAALHIVGCNPPIPGELASHVQVHGLLKSSVPAERSRLRELFRASHFLFMPSRAEAYGMALCEANAFGVPCVTTATGGITTIVREGVNGVALPVDAPAPVYADTITALVAEPDRYAALAHASFKEFERRLNWRAWMQSFLPRLQQIATAAMVLWCCVPDAAPAIA